MRIAINCRSFLNKNYTGIGRYTSQLIQSLSVIDQQNEYLLYTAKNLFNIRRRVPRPPAKNFFVKVDRFNRGVEETTGPFDIYHAPSPEDIEVKTSKVVVTVHDLVFKAFPKVHTSQTIKTTERQMQAIIKRAAKIICCSQSTIDDLTNYFSIERKKTVMIYQGVNKNEFYPIGESEDAMAESAIASKGIDEQFLLFVGTIEPRKNLENLLKAYELLRNRKKFSGKLVLIGMKGWMNDPLNTLVNDLGLKNHVLFLGFLSNQELRYFYNKAQVFVFPSFYEGFGFPIVEAFNCGLPVVTSNVSSCSEIAGEAALKVNPNDIDAIAQAIARILHNDDLRRTLREKGFKRAGDFSFAQTARQTLEVYKEVHGS